MVGVLVSIKLICALLYNAMLTRLELQFRTNIIMKKKKKREKKINGLCRANVYTTHYIVYGSGISIPTYRT